MTHLTRFASDVAFTPSVKRIQSEKGSRAGYARMERGSGWETTVTPELEAFLAGLDMFYLGTANAEGQPYVQYRGGPVGFLKVVDQKTLGFADFGGNRQYISTGNLTENPRAFLFLMDYVNAQRIKLWGRARIVENDPALLRRLGDPAYPGAVERAVLFEIEAWDANCPQHIHKRYPQSLVARAVEKLQQEVQELRAKVAACGMSSSPLRQHHHDRGQLAEARIGAARPGSEEPPPGQRASDSSGAADNREPFPSSPRGDRG